MLILKALAKARPPQMQRHHRLQTAGDQVAEGTERKAEDQHLPDARDRCEQPERSDEILVPEASSSVSPNAREVTTEDTLASSGLKRPQEDDTDGEEHPPARKARLEALCSLVHGDLGRPEQTSKDRSETEGLTSAVMCRSPSGKQNSADSHLTEAHSEWDVSWTPWWSYSVRKQVPPELTKDQITEAKKVELQKFAERGVYEVVDWSEAEVNPESVMLSAKFVITNKETVECPQPRARLVAREFASDAIDRDTVFWYTRAVNCQKLDLGSCHSEIVRKEIQGNALGCVSERPLVMKIPKEDPASEDPHLMARLVRFSVRGA